MNTVHRKVHLEHQFGHDDLVTFFSLQQFNWIQALDFSRPRLPMCC